MPNPDLAAVAEWIRSYYRRKSPREGVVGTTGKFGFYTRHLDDPSLDSLVLDPLVIDDIPAMFDDIRDVFGRRAVRIYIEDRRLDNDLCAALEEASCGRKYALVYLAHSGETQRVVPATGVRIEAVREETLVEYEVARMKGFADSEEEPDPAEVAANVSSLRLELEAGNRCLIGRMGTEVAAIMGWEEGKDRLVFNLATRVPFRRRGIAKYLLSYLIANTYEEGRRSIAIFADPSESPIQFYRRMGFTNEVYWQARYVYTPLS